MNAISHTEMKNKALAALLINCQLVTRQYWVYSSTMEQAHAQKGPRPPPLALLPKTPPACPPPTTCSSQPAGQGLFSVLWPHPGQTPVYLWLWAVSASRHLWGPICLAGAEPPGTSAETWPVSVSCGGGRNSVGGLGWA